MILDFNLLGLMVSAFWGIFLGTRALSLVILSAAIFCSNSIPVSLMVFILMVLIEFVLSSSQSRRIHQTLLQKQLFVVLLGAMSGLLGAALGVSGAGGLWVFFGLIVGITGGVFSTLFHHAQKDLRPRAFLSSQVAIGFVALDILLKIKSNVRVENAALWDQLLLWMGSGTFIYTAWIAWAKGTRADLIRAFSIGLLGLGTAGLGIDDPEKQRLIWSTLAIYAVGAPVLIRFAAHAGRKAEVLSRALIIGFPGGVGSVALTCFAKSAMTHAPEIMLPFVIGMCGFITALTGIGFSNQALPTGTLRLRSLIALLAYLVSGVVLLYLIQGGRV